MRHITTTVLTLVAAISAGCSATLEGEWDGIIDCGSAGAVPMTLDIESNGSLSYDATGSVTNWNIDGDEAALLLELELDQDSAFGAQTIDVEAQCVRYVSGGTPATMDCEGFSELGWDGEDMLAAEVENFLGKGVDCDLELER